MANWTEIASAIAAIVASVTGIVVAVIALKGYSSSKKLEFEANRPFVIPKLSIYETARQRQLYLTIKNAGDTPAKNVKLHFESEGAWHWVSNPDYPFANSNGISVLGPGEETTYFLGAIRAGNPLEDIETRELFGTVIFDHPIHQGSLTDSFRASLTENRYKAK